jgi:hypothetical protein
MTREEIIREYEELSNDPPQDRNLHEECVKLILSKIEKFPPLEQKEIMKTLVNFEFEKYRKMSPADQAKIDEAALKAAKKHNMIF